MWAGESRPGVARRPARGLQARAVISFTAFPGYPGNMQRTPRPSHQALQGAQGGVPRTIKQDIPGPRPRRAGWAGLSATMGLFTSQGCFLGSGFGLPPGELGPKPSLSVNFTVHGDFF